MRFGRVRGAVGLAALVVGLLLIFPLGSSCGETCPTPEQLAYFEEQADANDRFIAADSVVDKIMVEAQASTELLYDELWRQRLRRALDESNAALRAMADPEVPFGLEEYYVASVRTSEAYIEANELLWQGVLADSGDLINQWVARWGEADRLGVELMTMLRDFCK